MKTRQLLESKREEILRIAMIHGARNVRLFGSAARNEDKTDSDIDFLVEMEPGRGMLDLVALWQDLEELLKRKVDVLTEGGLSPYLAKKILEEATPL